MGYSNTIIIAGQPFPIDWACINFTEGPMYDSSSLYCNRNAGAEHGSPVAGGELPFAAAAGITGTNRFRPRQLTEFSYAAARAKIKQFVIHLDGCDGAQTCFAVLQNERGLSVHFMLDNNGTIYQTLDLAHCAYHANGMNETSIGIEICNRGEAKGNLDFYSKRGQSRDIVTVNIQGDTILSFDFTAEQKKAMVALGRFIAKALPNIGLSYPNNAGAPIFSMLHPEDAKNTALKSYSGYLAHYHTNIQKWDPGPFDFHDFMNKIRGSKSFPIGVHGTDGKETTEIPKDPDELDAAMKTLYTNNELSDEGGYFPVGEFDRYRLWHGGVHFHADEGDNVVAPWAGFVVAARNGPYDDNIGSTNFVLLKHSFKVSDAQLEFYSLYMHLQEEGAPPKPVDNSVVRKDKHGNIIKQAPTPTEKPKVLKWMENAAFATAQHGTLVTFPSPGEPVQAGDVLGHFGLAGPDKAPQIHFEVFTLDTDAVDKIDTEKRWNVVDGSTDGRFCSRKEILDMIEGKKKDGVITKDEELAFFHGDSPERDTMHWLVTYHVSEWYEGSPSWADSLRGAGELKLASLKDADMAKLVDDQITPTIWWTEDDSPALDLPSGGMVYTYHPITFVKWLNDKLDSAKADVGVHTATAADIDAANKSTTKLKQDLDDTTGASFVDADEITLVPESKKLQLPDMIDGYGD